MKKSIVDIHGREYQMTLRKINDYLYRMEIKQQKEYAGEAKLHLRMPDTMILEDIKIRNDFDPPESLMEEIMQGGGDFGLPEGLMIHVAKGGKNTTSKKNYRRIGLGTALLKEVVYLARQRGLKRIYGSVTKKDIIRTPHLLEWYARHGFNRCDPYPNCIATAEAWICMELN